MHSGRHRSPHKGYSVEFKEHRAYVRGDEPRTIDWKAFAKSDRLFIREYEEETNLRCTLLLDRSGSMGYGGDRAVFFSGRRASKFVYAQVLAATIAQMMIRSSDSIGVMTFDDAVRDIVPARSRPGHLQAILAAIARTGDHGEADLGTVMRTAAAKIGRRGLVVVITDAAGPVEPLVKSLAMIRSRPNDVVLFEIADPDECDLPLDGRIQFTDLEGWQSDVTVDAASIRSAYLQRRSIHQDALQTACRRHRVDRILVTTDTPVSSVLTAYLAQRSSAATPRNSVSTSQNSVSTSQNSGSTFRGKASG